MYLIRTSLALACSIGHSIACWWWLINYQHLVILVLFLSVVYYQPAWLPLPPLYVFLPYLSPLLFYIITIPPLGLILLPLTPLHLSVLPFSLHISLCLHPRLYQSLSVFITWNIALSISLRIWLCNTRPLSPSCLSLHLRLSKTSSSAAASPSPCVCVSLFQYCLPPVTLSFWLLVSSVSFFFKPPLMWWPASVIAREC